MMEYYGLVRCKTGWLMFPCQISSVGSNDSDENTGRVCVRIDDSLYAQIIGKQVVSCVYGETVFSSREVAQSVQGILNEICAGEGQVEICTVTFKDCAGKHFSIVAAVKPGRYISARTWIQDIADAAIAKDDSNRDILALAPEVFLSGMKEHNIYAVSSAI